MHTSTIENTRLNSIMEYIPFPGSVDSLSLYGKGAILGCFLQYNFMRVARFIALRGERGVRLREQGMICTPSTNLYADFFMRKRHRRKKIAAATMPLAEELQDVSAGNTAQVYTWKTRTVQENLWLTAGHCSLKRSF